MNLWYVIQTKPKKEEEATGYLSMKGIEIFSPLIETFTLRKGRVDKKLKPLFPSYLFVKFDLEKNYSLVRWARGVKKVLGFGGYPTPISEEVINTIMDRIDEQGVVRIGRHFKKNDIIRINSGPFKDLIGIFERWIPDKERVRVLLNLIGYQPEVELHFSMIEKVA